MTDLPSRIGALARLLYEVNNAGGDLMGFQPRHHMAAINRHLEELLPGFVLAPKTPTEMMFFCAGNVAPSFNDEPGPGRIGDRAAAEAYRVMLANRPQRPDHPETFPLPKRWLDANPSEWPSGITPEDWWQESRKPKQRRKGGAA